MIETGQALVIAGCLAPAIHNGIHSSLIGLGGGMIGMAGGRVALNTTIDEDLNVVIRLLARLKFGDKKGSISMAIEEALEKWAIENKDLIEEDELWISHFFGCKDIEEALKKGLKEKE